MPDNTFNRLKTPGKASAPAVATYTNKSNACSPDKATAQSSTVAFVASGAPELSSTTIEILTVARMNVVAC